jgi:hypothetical protein
VNLDFKKSAIKHPTINGDGLMQYQKKCEANEIASSHRR